MQEAVQREGNRLRRGGTGHTSDSYASSRQASPSSAQPPMLFQREGMGVWISVTSHGEGSGRWMVQGASQAAVMTGFAPQCSCQKGAALGWPTLVFEMLGNVPSDLSQGLEGHSS